MPDEKQHIQWALHNIDVIQYLHEKPLFCDWVATVAFYAALHIVDAVLHHQETVYRRQHGFAHDQRRNILRQSGKYKGLYANYSKLRTHSQIARYLQLSRGGAMFFQQYMTFEQVTAVLLQQQLKTIMQLACKLVTTQSAGYLREAIGRIPTA